MEKEGRRTYLSPQAKTQPAQPTWRGHMRLLPLQAGKQVTDEHRGRARQLPASLDHYPFATHVWEPPSPFPLPPPPPPPLSRPFRRRPKRSPERRQTPAWPSTSRSPLKLSP